MRTVSGAILRRKVLVGVYSLGQTNDVKFSAQSPLKVARPGKVAWLSIHDLGRSMANSVPKERT